MDSTGDGHPSRKAGAAAVGEHAGELADGPDATLSFY
jgi:hypothetical protein